MQPSVIHLAERIRAELLQPTGAGAGTVATALGVAEADPAFQRALRFLHDRAEILVDLGARKFYLRSSVATAITEALADGSALTQEELRHRLRIGVGVIADVVGWLTTERRLETVDEDRIRRRRSSSGSAPVTPPETGTN